MQNAIRNDAGRIIGWIQDGCTHPICKQAIRAGRKLHAVPAGYCASLPDYHYATEVDAIAALRAEAELHPEKLAEAEEIRERIRTGKPCPERR